MTVKIVVLYTQPDDPAAFDEHYLGVHMPLVAALPGMQRAEAGRLTAALDGGGQTFYRIAELYFADDGAMKTALGSPEGQATAADYQKIAPPGSRMFVQVLRSVRDFARKEWPLRGSTTPRSAVADRRHPSGGHHPLAAPFGPRWGRGICDGHHLDPLAVFVLAAAPGVGTL